LAAPLFSFRRRGIAAVSVDILNVNSHRSQPREVTDEIVYLITEEM